jgi:hypothetical protein
LIKQVWRVRESSEPVWVKVRNNLIGCKRVLQRWTRKEGGDLKEKLQLKEQELLTLQMQDPGAGREEERQVRDEIHSLLEQDSEDVKWKQRAKENWLKYGNRNTKFFHASANKKKKQK